MIKTENFDRRAKRYEKKHKAELIAVLNNLQIFFGLLIEGRKPKPFVYGFLRAEPSDIIAIDERGAGPNLAATRLYVYPEIHTRRLYLLAIGDKSPRQSKDIQECEQLVAQIKRESSQQRKTEDEHEEAERVEDSGQAGDG